MDEVLDTRRWLVSQNKFHVNAYTLPRYYWSLRCGGSGKYLLPVYHNNNTSFHVLETLLTPLTPSLFLHFHQILESPQVQSRCYPRCLSWIVTNGDTCIIVITTSLMRGSPALLTSSHFFLYSTELTHAT